MQAIGERHGLVHRQRLPRRRRQPAPAHLLRRARTPDELERAKQANEELLRACIALGGTVTGEHGVGLDKAKNLPHQFAEADLNFMYRLRRVFDPDGIMNPGQAPAHPSRLRRGISPGAARAPARSLGLSAVAVSPPVAITRALEEIVGRGQVGDRPAAPSRPPRWTAVVPRWVVRPAGRRAGRPRPRARARRSAGGSRRAAAAAASGSAIRRRRLDLVLDLARPRRGARLQARGHGGQRPGGITAGRARRAARPATASGCRSIRRARRRALGGRRHRHRASGPLRLRYGTDARSAARRALRSGRRRHHLGRRAGRQVGDRLRRPQAAGGRARHARRARRADAAAASHRAGRGRLGLRRSTRSRPRPGLRRAPSSTRRCSPNGSSLLDAGGAGASGRPVRRARRARWPSRSASVAEAVRAQREAADGPGDPPRRPRARDRSGCLEPARCRARRAHRDPAAGEPARLGHWLAALEHVARDGGIAVVAVGEAGGGVLRAALRVPEGDGLPTPRPGSRVRCRGCARRWRPRGAAWSSSARRAR